MNSCLTRVPQSPPACAGVSATWVLWPSRGTLGRFVRRSYAWHVAYFLPLVQCRIAVRFGLAREPLGSLLRASILSSAPDTPLSTCASCLWGEAAWLCAGLFSEHGCLASDCQSRRCKLPIACSGHGNSSAVYSGQRCTLAALLLGLLLLASIQQVASGTVDMLSYSGAMMGWW